MGFEVEKKVPLAGPITIAWQAGSLPPPPSLSLSSENGSSTQRRIRLLKWALVG